MDNTKETRINNNLLLREYKDGLLYGTDALLLAAFASGGSRRKIVDIGSGSGVIGLLLLSHKKAAHITGVEIQEKYALLSKHNAAQNGFSSQYEAVNADIRTYRTTAGFADAVVTNPPYMLKDSGKKSLTPEKLIARHEECCTIFEVCRFAAYTLRSGGSFYAVHRPERLADLLYAMKSNSIEPKRLLPVCPSVGKKPSLILIEGRKDGASGLIFSSDFYLYTDSSNKNFTPQALKAIQQCVIDR